MNSELLGVRLHFGKNHDSKYGNKNVESIPANAVGIMDRGFLLMIESENDVKKRNILSSD
jgi:hypothetical protein